jgi:hypothetical protein
MRAFGALHSILLWFGSIHGYKKILSVEDVSLQGMQSSKIKDWTPAWPDRAGREL